MHFLKAFLKLFDTLFNVSEDFKKFKEERKETRMSTTISSEAIYVSKRPTDKKTAERNMHRKKSDLYLKYQPRKSRFSIKVADRRMDGNIEL